MIAGQDVFVGSSVADLRTPALLAEALRLDGLPAGRVVEVAAEPLPGGYSGARLSRLRLRIEPPGARVTWRATLILKEILPLAGWLGWASADTRVREAQLWRSGLLRALPATLTTATLAVACDGPQAAPTAGAVLLRDARARLLPRPTRAPLGRAPFLLRLLDDLARLHAAYWEDQRLADAAVGLTPMREALLLAAPATIAARLALGDHDPYLMAIPAGWDAFLALAPPGAAATLRAALEDPTRLLAAIARLPATLVHGDVWGPNLGVLPPARHPAGTRTGARTLLLDWALATAGPGTYDPLWLVGTWHALDPHRLLAHYRASLARRLARRGRPLDAATWRALEDTGYLRTALVCGEAFGRVAAQAPAGAPRARAEERARWWAARAAQAAQRLAQA